MGQLGVGVAMKPPLSPPSDTITTDLREAILAGDLSRATLERAYVTKAITPREWWEMSE